MRVHEQVGIGVGRWIGECEWCEERWIDGATGNNSSERQSRPFQPLALSVLLSSV